jgi:hypothetical protein
MTQTYITTIRLLIVADTECEAADEVSEVFRHSVIDTVLDWSYIPTADGKTFTYPVSGPNVDLETYVEGDFTRSLIPNP